MNNIRQPAMGMVILMVFVGLITIIYTGFSNEYNFETDDSMLNDDGFTMSQAIEDLDLTDNIVQLSEDIISITTPSNPFDVLGAIAASGIGVVKLLYQITTYPVSILNVVNAFYGGWIPQPLVEFVKVVFIIGLAFVILSVILKRDV